jgi:carboxyl-terminal processing protease
MRTLERMGRVAATASVLVVAIASYFALTFGTGNLWRGLEMAHAIANTADARAPYDLTQLVAVNETLKTIRAKYVEPGRVNPRQMFLSALNEIQQDVAQVIVLHDENSPSVKVRVYQEEREFRVSNVQGPWDVAARLREVFAFLQQHLKDTEVDLREVEYAACNGMLRTLDPHSTFLSPEAYREMNLSTSGHFGGLGIVISVRDQQLTVMRPMPGTPAGRAGLKRLDRITKINNESTLNMPLDDAVNRLRGRPGTKVTVWIHRDGAGGWPGSRPFELTREEISISSVDGRLLADGVAYVRIKQFQSSTSTELERALDDLRKKDRFKALVLDLRGNPGGLLDQAAEVADKFLDAGVIVSTVGASEGRDEKRAERNDTEPPYPIVVLVNGTSASASEIVAGALKNLDRAAIVGQTTFGKGTVQLVFPRITPDGAALKLTIAQYLTPGDVSIQGVGVSPDVELDPMTADPLEMDLFRSDSLRERDLEKSLAGGARKGGEPPFFKLRYNLPEAARAKIRELGGDLDDEFTMDYPIEFGRELALKLTTGKRQADLLRAKPFLEKAQEEQIAEIAADLKKLGVDWSAPPKPESAGGKAPGPLASDYDVVVATDRKDDTVDAGQPMQIEVRVTNKSERPVYQLRAITKSDGAFFDEKELVFGKVGPGETVVARAPLGWCDIEGRKPGSTQPVKEDAKRGCKIPMSAVTRQDVVKVRFSAEGGEPPRDAEIRPTVRSLPQPIFAYTYQVVDNRPGNGDGQLVRGEGATVYLTVKNVGKGRSYETQANLRNLSGDGLLLHAGRFDVSNMQPGDVREVALTFDVLDGLKETFAKVEISIADRDLGVISSEKLTLPVPRSGLSVAAGSGSSVVKSAAAVREQPTPSGRVVGTLEGNSVVERLGTVDDFTKVRLAGERFGFVETRLLGDSTKQAKPAFNTAFTRSPPLLDVKTGSLATRDGSVVVEGIATDSDGVLDAYVFVGADKVFYKSSPKSTKGDKLSFRFDAKLKPGVNVITVVAREDEDTATRYTRIVRRDGPKGEALPTPKQELFGADWVFGGMAEP